MPMIAFPVPVPQLPDRPELQAAITEIARYVALRGTNYITDVLDVVDEDVIIELSKDPQDIMEDFAKYLYDLHLKGKPGF